MAKIMLDFSNMPDNDDNLLLPEGQYLAIVEETKEGTSKNGFAKVDITFNITEPGPYEGWKQWYTITSAPKARRFTRRALVALGYEFSGLTGRGVLDLNQTIGNECILVVEHQEYTPEQGPNRGKTVTSARTTRLLSIDDSDEDEPEVAPIPTAVAAPSKGKKKVAWKDLPQ